VSSPQASLSACVRVCVVCVCVCVCLVVWCVLLGLIATTLRSLSCSPTYTAASFSVFATPLCAFCVCVVSI
jgi:hypothetical protein